MHARGADDAWNRHRRCVEDGRYTEVAWRGAKGAWKGCRGVQKGHEGPLL